MISTASAADVSDSDSVSDAAIVDNSTDMISQDVMSVQSNDYNNVVATVDDEKTFSSLQTAVTNTNTGATLYLNGSYYKATSSDKTVITISKSITIDGSYANGTAGITTIDASGLTNIFNINSGTVTFKNIIFLNGNSTDNGAAIYLNTGSSLIANNTKFINNTATTGGAIYAYGSQLISINNTEFTNNTATDWGGAIYNAGYKLIINNSIFENNVAAYDDDIATFYLNINNSTVKSKIIRIFVAGLIVGVPNGETLYLNNSYISALLDSALENGTVYMPTEVKFAKTLTIDGLNENGTGERTTIDGALSTRLFWITSGTVTFNNTNFINGKASGYGGAIRANSVKLYNCAFMNNTLYDLPGKGGGAAVYADTTAYNCTFIGNGFDAQYQWECGGGAILSSEYGSHYLVNCTFQDNWVTDYHAWAGGGALRGSGTVINCTFIGNIANTNECGGGGAIYADGLMKFYNVTFIGNIANVNSHEAGGGAVYTRNRCEVYDCTFINNTENGGGNGGGAIILAGEASADSLIVSNSIFVNNTATGGEGGGAIHNNGRTFTITNCTFINNTANNGGGAVYNAGNILTVDDCDFTNNTANEGGAVYSKTNTNITNCSFVNNTAHWEGGVIYTNGNTTATNCSFVNSTATNGGAIAGSKGGTTVVYDSSFVNSTADWNGGAIYNEGSTTTNNCTFIDSSAENGGAIYTSGNTTISNSSFINSNATNNGGAIYNTEEGLFTVTNSSKFINNTANYNGGAIYAWGSTVLSVNDTEFTNNTATTGGGEVFSMVVMSLL